MSAEHSAVVPLTNSDWDGLRYVRDAWPVMTRADRGAVLAVVRAMVERKAKEGGEA